MPKLDKSTLIDNIKRGYFHNPYIAKLSCVDIIQFIERFIRFDLYPSIDIVGVKDQREWERLVRNYLEEVHSFIDIQRKIAAGFSKFVEIDLEPVCRSIIEPVPIDSKIVQELRRRVHHESIHIIYICETWDRGGYIPAIPHIQISDEWFSDELIKARVRETWDNRKLLWHLFGTHCDHFIDTSNSIGNVLLEKLGQPIVQPRNKV